jgi:nitrogen fixation protein FixH
MQFFRRDQPYELTGRHVLLWLVAFFAIVFAVNLMMMRAAISTFGGVTASSSYAAGLQFEHEVGVAERQDALHWQVDEVLSRGGDGRAALEITAHDAGGAPLAGLTAQARLVHPADERLDHVIDVRPAAAGVYRGETAAPPGQWDLVLELYRGDQRVFRSRSRVTLKQ